eukprot:XP_006535384.1 PREDICTED: uncharacterized protein Gm33370 isoform X1 [Mus musculus]
MTKVIKNFQDAWILHHLPELRQNPSKTKVMRDFSPDSWTPADGLTQDIWNEGIQTISSRAKISMSHCPASFWLFGYWKPRWKSVRLSKEEDCRTMLVFILASSQVGILGLGSQIKCLNLGEEVRCSGTTRGCRFPSSGGRKSCLQCVRVPVQNHSVTQPGYSLEIQCHPRIHNTSQAPTTSQRNSMLYMESHLSPSMSLGEFSCQPLQREIVAKCSELKSNPQNLEKSLSEQSLPGMEEL